MHALVTVVYGVLTLVGAPTSVAALQDRSSPHHHRTPDCSLHQQHIEVPPAPPSPPAAPDQKHDPLTQPLAARGAPVMGFDQQAATHHFILTPDGGRIEITANDPSDDEVKRRAMLHLTQTATQFGRGDFSAPRAIHAEDPPGLDVMKRLRLQMRYEVANLPTGGVLRISSASREAIDAVHTFLRYQIREHRTGDSLDVTSGKR